MRHESILNLPYIIIGSSVSRKPRDKVFLNPSCQFATSREALLSHCRELYRVEKQIEKQRSKISKKKRLLQSIQPDIRSTYAPLISMIQWRLTVSLPKPLFSFSPFQCQRKKRSRQWDYTWHAIKWCRFNAHYLHLRFILLSPSLLQHLVNTSV